MGRDPPRAPPSLMSPSLAAQSCALPGGYPVGGACCCCCAGRAAPSGSGPAARHARTAADRRNSAPGGLCPHAHDGRSRGMENSAQYADGPRDGSRDHRRVFPLALCRRAGRPIRLGAPRTGSCATPQNQGLTVIARLGLVPGWARPRCRKKSPRCNYLPDEHFADFADYRGSVCRALSRIRSARDHLE